MRIPCYLENRVVREPCKRRTACILFPKMVKDIGIMGSWPFQEVGHLLYCMQAWPFQEVGSLLYWEDDNFKKWATTFITCKLIISRGGPPFILGSWSFPEVGLLLYCMQADHFQRRATSYIGNLTISRCGLPPILGRWSYTVDMNRKVIGIV